MRARALAHTNTPKRSLIKMTSTRREKRATRAHESGAKCSTGFALTLVVGLLLVGAAGSLRAQQQPSTSAAGVLSSLYGVEGGAESSAPTTPTAATTAPSSSTTLAGGAPADEPEPATSTADTISVNSDETLTTMDEASAPDAESGGGGDDDAAIEAKSISQGGRDNLVARDDEPADDEPRQTTASVNMSQVELVYTSARRDERATAESWRRLGKKLKKGVGSVIGALVPLALNMSQEAKISTNCSGAMLKWVLSMNQLKSWALRMLDASGKPVAGLLEGSMTMFGNYRQCLKIRAPDDDEIEFAGTFKEYFRGKYCIIQLKPWLPEKSRFYNLNTKLQALARGAADDGADADAASEADSEAPPSEPVPDYERTVIDELAEWALAFNFVNIRYDLCVPSMCKREDMQKALNYLLRGIDLKARVERCEMDSPEAAAAVAIETSSADIAEALAAAPATVKGARADGQRRAANTIGDYSADSFSQLGWILIPLIATVLVLVSTALSLTIGADGAESDAAATDDASGSAAVHDARATKSSPAKKLARTINSLSLKRSVDSHLNVDYDQLADDKPLSLYGVRLVLVLWVILVESAVNLKFEFLRELLMLKDLIFWWPMQIIINSTLQYDSFILLTAFTMGYKNCLNDNVNSAKAITRFVLDKYVRLMPSIMLMVALVILLPLTYRGPVWNDYVTTQSAVCQSTGWVNSIFLQNYLPYEQICLPQTWLLCVEFQLILLMAPIVYYLNKSYTANYGNGIKSLGAVKKDVPSSLNSRSRDSSRMFHWLWTTPGIILVICILVSMIVSFYNVYYRELPPTWFYTMADPDSKAVYFFEHMTKVWTHLAVFAMGLLAGIECRRAAKNVIRGYKGSNIDYITHNSFSRQHKSQSSSASSLPVTLAQNGSLSSAKSTSDINNWQSSVSINMSNNTTTGSNEILNCRSPNSSLCQHNDHRLNISKASHNINHHHHDDEIRGRGLCALLFDIIISLIAITTMSLIIFSTHDWSLNDLPKPYVAGLFDAGSRFLWSIAMIWLLYMISVPNKDRSFSILARSLGHPLMVCLGKLSFLIYIIHPFVHTTVLAIQEQPIYSSWLMLFHILIGNITITVILASLVSLFVEMPCRNLFRRCGTSLLLTQSNIITTSNGASTTATSTATSSTVASTTTSPGAT